MWPANWRNLQPYSMGDDLLPVVVIWASHRASLLPEAICLPFPNRLGWSLTRIENDQQKIQVDGFVVITYLLLWTKHILKEIRFTPVRACLDEKMHLRPVYIDCSGNVISWPSKQMFQATVHDLRTLMKFRFLPLCFQLLLLTFHCFSQVVRPSSGCSFLFLTSQGSEVQTVNQSLTNRSFLRLSLKIECSSIHMNHIKNDTELCSAIHNRAPALS